MKNNTLLIAAVLASAASFSTSAFAASPNQTAAAQQTVTKPVPVKVVSPTDLPREYENATVQLMLTIDQDGVPHDVKPMGAMDRRVATSLIAAVSQWRFTPNYVNGQPVTTRVLLPLQLVDRA